MIFHLPHFELEILFVIFSLLQALWLKWLVCSFDCHLSSLFNSCLIICIGEGGILQSLTDSSPLPLLFPLHQCLVATSSYLMNTPNTDFNAPILKLECLCVMKYFASVPSRSSLIWVLCFYFSVIVLYEYQNECFEIFFKKSCDKHLFICACSCSYIGISFLFEYLYFQ